VSGARDPYAVLGVARGASDAEIHAAYRAAVRRAHPDAGGSAGEFEAVQRAYELLRERHPRARAQATAPPRASRPGAERIDPRDARARMEDLLAESRRLEDEARALAGLPPRHEGGEPASSSQAQEDSFGAILRDAGAQLREIADEGGRELRRFIRRRL
jgi:curved DNA-binding protein CbpA